MEPSKEHFLTFRVILIELVLKFIEFIITITFDKVAPILALLFFRLSIPFLALDVKWIFAAQVFYEKLHYLERFSFPRALLPVCIDTLELKPQREAIIVMCLK